MSRSNSTASVGSSSSKVKPITSGTDAAEILQRIFNADCNPSNLDPRQLRKSFVELLEQHRKLQDDRKELEQDKLELEYRVNLLEEEMFELDEFHHELKRKLKIEQKAKDEADRRTNEAKKLLEQTNELLEHRDKLIEAAGLVLFADINRVEELKDNVTSAIPESLLTKDIHDSLDKHSKDGTLDQKLRAMISSKEQFEMQISSLTNELNELKLHMIPPSHNGNLESNDAVSIGTPKHWDSQSSEKTSSSREMTELKKKVERQNEEIQCLRAERERLENALSKQKEMLSLIEESEQKRDEERKQLKRDLRDANAKITELSYGNKLLVARLDALKESRPKEKIDSPLNKLSNPRKLT